MSHTGDNQVVVRPPIAGRLAGIDAVRLVGIVAVVAGHAFTGRVAHEVTFPWHVPLFFFLSGYLWRPGRGLGDEWGRRWRSLARPYLAWLAIIAAVLLPATLVVDGRSAVVRKAGAIVLGGSYLKSPYHAFWFVSCLFAACMLYRLLERSWRWDPLWLVPPLVVVAWLAGPALAFVPASLGVAIPATVFVVLGHQVRRVPGWARSWPAGLAALSAGALLVATGTSRPLDIKNGDFGTPVVGIAVATLICFGLMTCGEVVARGLPARVQAAVIGFAGLGLVVILTHGVPLYMLGGRGPQLLAFALSLGFGLACAVAVSRSRWSATLLGR